MVVDDLVENTRVLERFLTPRGYDVICLADGEAALEAVAAQPPDVILLDLMMPGMDGFEVCRQLKESQDTRHIPVIIITGMRDKEANVKALEAGADDFLVKPFDAILLGARIRSSLRSKMMQDQIINYQQQLEEANQNLERRVCDRTAQVIHTQHVALFSLARLAESRDTETGAHLERIRLYVRELARQLLETGRFDDEIDDDFVDKLYLSSPLHDIGKVGIPDRILLKPGRLTHDEFEIMKTHAVIGGDTLRAADLEAGQDSFLAMSRDIAYSHHERWDGAGYPSGLGKTDIPLSARLTAVADVYDALTSRRPYKEPMSHAKSKSLIVEGCGTQFDPDIVDAFLAREEAIVAIGRHLVEEDAAAPIVALDQALGAAELKPEQTSVAAP